MTLISIKRGVVGGERPCFWTLCGLALRLSSGRPVRYVFKVAVLQMSIEKARKSMQALSQEVAGEMISDHKNVYKMNEVIYK